MIEIRKIRITDLDTDAVVNAANEGLAMGGGVCGAIFKDAGTDPLQDACRRIGHCDTGSAVLTPGFNLRAKYIIHAVGPIWSDGKHDESKKLYRAYRRSLELAVETGCKSIAFPLLSAGASGYPVDLAWRKALQVCVEFLDQGYEIDIVFAVLSDQILKNGQEILRKIAPQYAIAVRSDWKILDMPARQDRFILDRHFSQDEMKTLRKGNIPKEMEDKWFWYMEGNKLFAHRSWTGFCIYCVEFSPDHHHKVTVNQDPEQVRAPSIDEDRRRLDKLLTSWAKAPYDSWIE